MAHMIESDDEICYVGEVPWHGKGVEVDPSISPNDMLIRCGADWETVKSPLFIKSADGEFKPVGGKHALIRETDGKVLDYVGDRWTDTQNRAALDFFNDMCAHMGVKMETMGTLRGGRWFWALANLNDGFALRDNDIVKGYLLFSNPHMWGYSINAQFTPIRVVCNNTLTQAVGEFDSSTGYRQGHSKEFDVKRAKEVMGIAIKKLDAFQEQAVLLSSKTADMDTVKEYFSKLFPQTSNGNDSRNFEKAMGALTAQPGAEMSEGTLWSAFNAVTYLVDHQAGRGVDTRLASAWYGDGKLLKQRALDLALKMAA